MPKVKSSGAKRRKPKKGTNPSLSLYLTICIAALAVVIIYLTFFRVKNLCSISKVKAQEVVSYIQNSGWSLLKDVPLERGRGRKRWVTTVTIWKVQSRISLPSIKEKIRDWPGLSFKEEKGGTDWHLSYKGLEILMVSLIFEPIKTRARVSIVIDDIGYDVKEARELLEMRWPITLSVLPFTPHGREIAEMAHRKGREVMLHIPMQPNSGGELIEKLEAQTPGMLKVDMSDSKVRSLLREEISRVPYARGANNHMGSRFTSNERKIKVVLRELKSHHIFFLDSRTYKTSVAYKVAGKLGMKRFKRDIFLDNSKDVDYILHQLDTLSSLALRRGYAIAIGHPSEVTILALKRKLPDMERMGIKVVPLSEL